MRLSTPSLALTKYTPTNAPTSCVRAADDRFNPDQLGYRRAGTRNILMTCEPLTGWRHVAITQRRTMQDFAHQMQWLMDEVYPDALVVRVVLEP